MGIDFLGRIGRRHSGPVSERGPVAGGPPSAARDGGPPAPTPVSDKVSLSAAYRVIKKLETGVRIKTLRLHVSRKTYWIPAAQVSRSMIEEHLAA